jgi:hypothetical protein
MSAPDNFHSEDAGEFTFPDDEPTAKLEKQAGKLEQALPNLMDHAKEPSGMTPIKESTPAKPQESSRDQEKILEQLKAEASLWYEKLDDYLNKIIKDWNNNDASIGRGLEAIKQKIVRTKEILSREDVQYRNQKYDLNTEEDTTMEKYNTRLKSYYDNSGTNLYFTRLFADKFAYTLLGDPGYIQACQQVDLGRTKREKIEQEILAGDEEIFSLNEALHGILDKTKSLITSGQGQEPTSSRNPIAEKLTSYIKKKNNEINKDKPPIEKRLAELVWKKVWNEGHKY